ncbi:MAG: hypothetical protein U0900_04535 [Myxococcota bacterium]
MQIDVTGNGSGAIHVAVGRTAVFCRDPVSQVEPTRLAVAPASCAPRWRVDRD